MKNFMDINPKVIYTNGIYVYEKNGKKIKRKDVERIKGLKIPLVYTTLWLSKDPESDIQAIALGAKDKKQYFYSEKWIDKRSSEKFKRIYKFVHKLPILHQQMSKDMKRRNYSRRKVIAYMIRIMELTNIRIGNKKYLDQNESFGLTTLKKEHITFEKGKVVLNFRGKHGVSQKLKIQDTKVSNFIKKLMDLPTDWIMKFQSSDDNWYRVSAQDVNTYIHNSIGDEFTCKDFRTHGANTTFLRSLKKYDIPQTEKAKKHNISKSLEITAKKLGHNKSTSKKSYVMDYIINEYTKNPKWVCESFLIQILKKA